MINPLEEFVSYCKKHIKGDEKGEAQIFMDRFFTALGYADGLKGAGAECEYRVKDAHKKSTSFADLVWKPRVLIEMKKRGEDLSLHYQQAFSYWLQLVPNRPQYVILCNFDEFWIYDLNEKLYDPLDKVLLDDLVKHHSAFAFLLPTPKKPVFLGKQEDVTENAAKMVSAVYKSMVNRRIAKPAALRYCLQCIIAMFAEDTGLLPDNIFTGLMDECARVKNGAFIDQLVPLSYDLIGGLFKEMNNIGITPTGKYKGVDYFNGGLFKDVLSIELRQHEIEMLDSATRKNWVNVNPAIFGTIFEQFMEKEERHILGAHYTHETDIMKIIDPVIVQPWTRKIEEANTLNEFYSLIRELRNFKVLDPACGSGNFLFIAFKEMKLLEKSIINRIRALSTKRIDAEKLRGFLRDEPFVNTKQFYGIDIKEDAVELAKVTLMVAKELWVTQNANEFDREPALPLDNLDDNIKCEDALLNADGSPRVWPEADAIIGNPPYQSKRNMQAEFGADYVNKLRTAYPEMPGRADFCVYWFYKAHNHLKKGGCAGLVGTNTIIQNYSREGGLEYIVTHGGTIFNAYQSFKWSGEAAVTVSIVAWAKGKYDGQKLVYTQANPKAELQVHNVNTINSSISLGIDLINAFILDSNRKPKKVFQGQIPALMGYLIPKSKAQQWINKNPKYSEVLKPHLIADELIGNFKSQPSRFVADFETNNQIEVAQFKELYAEMLSTVYPLVKMKAEDEVTGKTKDNGRKDHFEVWWKLWRRRENMLDEFKKIKRYIACSGVSKRNIFEFVSTEIIPNAAVFAFTFDDDYSFGIIQSSLHWEWWKAKCSTLRGDYRYTANTVWDTFPWPQNPTLVQIEKISSAAKALRDVRNSDMNKYHYSLRDLYRIVEHPGKNPIKDLHSELDQAVIEAYNFDSYSKTSDNTNPFIVAEPLPIYYSQAKKVDKDYLKELLALNLLVHEKELRKEPVQAPGLPGWVKNKEKFISDDCVKFEG